MQDSVFTIGHSTHPQERFIGLLLKHGVTAACDVRSKPYSRMNFGARSDDPDCYVGGKVQYDRLAGTELFKQGLKRVIRGRPTGEPPFGTGPVDPHAKRA